jgi:hypothetical protein
MPVFKFDYYESKNISKKADLKNGDYTKLRNGEMGVYIINGGFINNTHTLGDSLFLDDLTCKSSSDFDIIEVRRLNNNITPILAAFTKTYDHTVIYKRKDPILWNGMTYEEAHRALWNALADGEVTTKREWFEWNSQNKKKDIPRDYCFACDLAVRNSKKDSNTCSHCPLCEWEYGDDCLKGLYKKWINAKGFEKFKLAHEIANLPWKEK